MKKPIIALTLPHLADLALKKPTIHKIIEVIHKNGMMLKNDKTNPVEAAPFAPFSKLTLVCGNLTSE